MSCWFGQFSGKTRSQELVSGNFSGRNLLQSDEVTQRERQITGCWGRVSGHGFTVPGWPRDAGHRPVSKHSGRHFARRSLTSIAIRSAATSALSCSQTTTTSQPASVSTRPVSASLARLPSTLAFQNSRFARGAM